MKNLVIQRKLIQFLKNNHIINNSLYWYPLINISESIPVVAYDIVGIYQDNNIYLLERIAEICDIKDVTMFQMDVKECFENESITQLLYEQDEDGFIFPWYAETFLFDGSEEWMIYLSHENTISFTGEKIVSVAKKIIPRNYLILVNDI